MAVDEKSYCTICSAWRDWLDWPWTLVYGVLSYGVCDCYRLDKRPLCATLYAVRRPLRLGL